MGKIAKECSNLYYTAQPREILTKIGAELYVHHYSDFIPATDAGKQFYKVYSKGEWYTSIIAKNENAAKKEFEKIVSKKNLTSPSLVFDHTIEFKSGSIVDIKTIEELVDENV